MKKEHEMGEYIVNMDGYSRLSNQSKRDVYSKYRAWTYKEITDVELIEYIKNALRPNLNPLVDKQQPGTN